MSSINMSRGCFIVFEGIDRCGKTTQTTRLISHLSTILPERNKVVLMRFPDRTTPSGKVIDQYLKNQVELDDKDIHLLFAENRRESEPKIRQLLHEGHTIVVDRYAYSGVCFSAAKKPSAKRDDVLDELSIEWCKVPDKGLPAPDLVVFLDMSVEQSKLRGDFGAERYEKEEFQKRVRENFLSLVDSNWCVIDAARSIEEVEKDVQDAAKRAILSLSKGDGKPVPIRELW